MRCLGLLKPNNPEASENLKRENTSASRGISWNPKPETRNRCAARGISRQMETSAMRRQRFCAANSVLARPASSITPPTPSGSSDSRFPCPPHPLPSHALSLPARLFPLFRSRPRLSFSFRLCLYLRAPVCVYARHRVLLSAYYSAKCCLGAYIHGTRRNMAHLTRTHSHKHTHAHTHARAHADGNRRHDGTFDCSRFRSFKCR